MTGDEVRQVFEAMLPQEEIDRLCQPCGGIEWQRTRLLGMLGRAMGMAAGTPGGAYQADVLRSSLEFAGPQVTCAAFYRWFDAPLEPCRAALAERALVYAQAQHVDLPGPAARGWGIGASGGDMRTSGPYRIGDTGPLSRTRQSTMQAPSSASGAAGKARS